MSLPSLSSGQRPSDIHRQMTSWLDTSDVELLNSEFLRALFLMKMPPDLKRMLLAHPKKKCDVLAVFADSLWISGGLRAFPPVISVPAEDLGTAFPSASPSPPGTSFFPYEEEEPRPGSS